MLSGHKMTNKGICWSVWPILVKIVRSISIEQYLESMNMRGSVSPKGLSAVENRGSKGGRTAASRATTGSFLSFCFLCLSLHLLTHI
jgi:hypothetical protein